MRRLILSLAFIAAPWFYKTAGADAFTLPSIDDLVSPTLQTEAARLAGVLSQHRPYQGATPLGTLPGLDAFLEVSLVQVPQGLIDELAASGLGATLPLRTLPVAKLHAHKGIYPRVDIGASYFRLLKYRIYGGDLKWAVWLPDEGPTVALRLCYSNASLDYLTSETWSPQIVVSRKLDFAEPYLGLEYTWISGGIHGKQIQDVSGTPVEIAIDIDGIRATSASAFMGLNLRVPVVGLKLGIEGAYSFVKAHSLGVQLGLSW